MVVKNISLRGKGEEGAHHRLSFPGTIHHSPWMLSFALKQAAKKEPTHYMMEACTHQTQNPLEACTHQAWGRADTDLFMNNHGKWENLGIGED